MAEQSEPKSPCIVRPTLPKRKLNCPLSKVTEELTVESSSQSKSPEQKVEPMRTPKPKRSCATLFWKCMAHPAIAALGVVFLLAGVAALLATTFGVGGVALAGVLIIAGSTATGLGGVSTLLSAVGFCRNRCAKKGKGENVALSQKSTDTGATLDAL